MGRCLSSGRILSPRGGGCQMPRQLGDDVRQAARHYPIWIVGAELARVRDIDLMISLAGLIDILPLEPPARRLLEQFNRLKDRDAVVASAPQVVDLAGAGVGGE